MRVKDGIRWIAARLAAVLAVALILLVALGVVLQRQNSGERASWARSTGHDALWMEAGWLAGPLDPGAVERLAARVRGGGVRHLFVHAGTLAAGGALDPGALRRAGPLTAALRDALPGVALSAWIDGDPVAGRLDLDRDAVRAALVDSGRRLLRAGFDGLHYDLKRIEEGDEEFLRLLEETRRLRPEPLSASAPKLEPVPGLRAPARLFTGRPRFWSPDFLAEVAERVDQVAVLCYDTGTLYPSWYGGYTARQTRLALAAVPADVELIMAVPAVHEGGGLGRRASAETVAAAVHGIRVGLSASGRRERFGIGLRGDATATEQDWIHYRRGWVEGRD